MKELWTQLQDNFSFVCVSLLIILVIGLLARLSESFLISRRKVSSARRVSIVGICAAIAAVLHILDFPLLFLAPEFYKLDFSELPVRFLFGTQRRCGLRRCENPAEIAAEGHLHRLCG